MEKIKSHFITVYFASLLAVSSFGSTSPCFAYEVLTKTNASLPITVIHVNFRVGSADDPVEMPGLAYMTARMLHEGGVKAFKKLPARSREQIEELLYPVAGEIDVTISQEQTSFEITVSKEDASSIFNLLTQMVLAPAWDKHEFDRIQAETIAMLEKVPNEQQEDLGKAILNKETFGEKHPYSHLEIGSLSKIKKIKLENIQEFYKKYYTQKRILVGLAGIIGKGISKAAPTVFSELPVGDTEKTSISTPKLNEKITLKIVKGPFKEAVGVHLGHPLYFTRSQFDTFSTMYMAAMAFGKHRSFVGRLMHEVREIRGLNYGTYAYIEDFPNGGSRLTEPTQAARQAQAFTMWGRPTTLENACFLTKQMHRALKKLVDHGLTKAEFELVQSHLVGAIPLQALSLGRGLGYSIDANFYGLPETKQSYLEQLAEKISSLTLKKVNDEIKKQLHPDKVNIVVVTSDPERFKKELLSEKCEIHYAPGIEKPTEVLEEDKKIATYSIGVKAEDIETIESKDVF